MQRRHFARIASASLLGGASILSLATPAQAQQVMFSTARDVPVGTITAGREVALAGATVQVKLASGAVASFVGNAQFSIRSDGAVDLRSGSVTIVAVGGTETTVHMPEGVRGTVAAGGTGSFTAAAGGSRGSTTAGQVSVTATGVTRTFVAGQFWTASGTAAPDRVIAGQAAAVPEAGSGPVVPLREGGIVAAAENGIPVALGEALAGVGARGDIVAAARRLEAYDANPILTRFPTGDYALLIGYAAEAASLGGGTAFPGAGADIVRTYFEYLASGRSGPAFRTAYAQILLNYLDLLRSGVLPSTFTGATQAQLSAYIAFIGRTEGFGGLSATNRQLLDAYLAFLQTGGQPNAFGTSVTGLTTAFLNYVRGGGDPAAFTQASASVVGQYLAIVNSGGLRTNLTAQNQALLAAYLANNGIGFTTSYATGLAAFVAFLNAGGLPSGYTALPAATVRQYLETLETTGLFDRVLGNQAVFLRTYLTFLRTGGTPDQFNALPINVARVNASALTAYVDFLLAGGLPSTYSTLTAAQIRAALDQLTATGQFATLLGANAAFLTEYYAYLQTGADPDTFAGLPSVDINAYASALSLFAAYLRTGGLPSGYATLTAQQVRNYLTALSVGGRLSLLGTDQALLADYLTYLRTGGAPDQFAGLPIVTYQGYATALATYFAYLNGGGLPTGYAALTQVQIRAYLDALRANNQLVLLGSNATFYTDYLAFLAGGGAPDQFAGLPIVTFQGYATALSAYFAYLNAGGVPSAYTALTQAQVRQYLDALTASSQLSALLGANAQFYTAYLTYLAGGGAPDQFNGLPIVTYRGYATALAAYYAYLVGGGTPGAYTALTQAQIRQYLDVLRANNQFTVLLGTNSAFFDAYLTYLAGGGDANAYPGLPSSTYGQYASALTAYFAYLNAGGLPSGYTALTAAQIREYLDVLRTNNQLTALLGSNAAFFEAYLSFVAGGGSPDAYTALPIVTYRGYASALAAYYAYLSGGGLPAAYSQLTQAQIRAYLDALKVAGQSTALLGTNAAFFDAYLTYLAGGGAPDQFAGLPAATYASYGTAIQAFVAFLRGGGLPGGYTALTAAQLREYLAVLTANGQAGRIGAQADIDLITAYATYLAGGGVPNQFAGLPVFVTYEAALRTYYAYLLGGGRPSAYTALSQSQIVAYIQALDAAGLVASKLTATEAAFLRDYASFVGGGGSADQFAGLPGNQPVTPTVPVVTQGLANAPRGSNIATAAAGVGLFSAATTSGSVVLNGNNVTSFSGSRGIANQNAATVEARTIDNTVGIARLASGTVNTGNNIALSAQTGMHLVWGTPATNMPTSGTATFGMVTATSPTRDSSGVEPGTFTGNLAVALATRRVGWDSVIGLGGVNYRFASAGGITAPSVAITSNNTFNGTASTANNGLAGNGSGFFAGNGGGLVGFAYLAQGPGVNGEIEGTAVFGRNAPVVTLPTVTPPTVIAPLPSPGYAYSGGFAGSTTTVYKTISNGAQRNSENNGAQVVIGTDGRVSQFASLVRNGTANVTDVAGNATGIVGRWTGDARTFFVGSQASTFSGAQSLHYFAVAPATFTKPTTGLVTYNLLAATQPTYGSGYGAAGLFDGRMAINFGTNRAGIVGTITMPDAAGNQTYNFGTTGGLTSPSQDLFTYPLNNLTFRAPTTGAGRGCGGTCELQIQGAFGGANVNTLGIIYNTIGATVTDPIYGAALFNGNAAPPTTGQPSLGYAYTAGLPTTGLRVLSNLPQANNQLVGMGTDNGSATPAADGTLTTIGGSGSGSYLPITRTTAKSADVAGNARVVLGRWYDGRVTPSGLAAVDLAANQSYHYVLAAPISFTMPYLGRVDYTLAAATRPTFGSGATLGGVFDARMAILFRSTPLVGLQGTIVMPEASGAVTYAFTTAGGVANPSFVSAADASRGYFQVDAGMTGSGLACTSDCTLRFTGVLAGADPLAAGGTYRTYGNRSGNGEYLTGAASFTGAWVGDAQTVRTVSNRQFTALGPSSAGTLNVNQGTYDVDGAGRVVGLSNFNGLYDRLGSAQIAQSGATTSGNIGWTRWSNGSPDVRRFGPSTVALNANQGYQILHGAAATALPTTGVVNYTLSGGTNPTDHAGTLTPGTLGTGSAAVSFGTTSKVAFDFTTSIGGATYNLFTTGKIAGIANSEITLTSGAFNNVISAGGNVTGGTCVGTQCRPIWNGFLAGAGGTELGLNYQVQNTTTQARFGGIAAFTATGAPTPPTGGSGFTGTLTGQTTYAYASSTLVDQGVTTTTYDNGALKSYRSFLTNSDRTAGVAQESGRLADVIGWVRWTGDAAGSLTNQGPNAGVHIMTGTPTAAASMPTSGTVQYTLAGGTKPTLTSTPLGAAIAAPGTITGSLGVAFGAQARVGIDLTATVGDYGWRVQTTGGAANPSQSSMTVTGFGTFSSTFTKQIGVTPTTAASCVTACSGTIGGQFYGPGGSHVGLAFNMLDAGAGGTVQSSGIAIFTKP